MFQNQWVDDGMGDPHHCVGHVIEHMHIVSSIQPLLIIIVL